MPTHPSSTYDPISRSLHWLTALAVLVAFVLGPDNFGRLVSDGEDPAHYWNIVVHESLGLLVLSLTVLRLLWLPLRPAVPRIAMSPVLHMAASAVRWGLWGLLLAVPCTALLHLASEAYPLTLLAGLHIDEFPWLTPWASALSVDWGELHEALATALLALSGLHALAAIFHHAVLRDGVLASMLPHVKHRRR